MILVIKLLKGYFMIAYFFIMALEQNDIYSFLVPNP